MTTFPTLASGDTVNLEFDMIGKYIMKMLKAYEPENTSVTLEKFRRAGF
jgi:riboflavin synthase alpha subunit